MKKVLIIEDDKNINELIRYNLNQDVFDIILQKKGIIVRINKTIMVIFEDHTKKVYTKKTLNYLKL
jgi:DNA-binding response OmpR family regulator